MRFRADVEGLRAVAVAMVVAFHAGIPGFPGGFLGVDMFFVLSGYLITQLLVDEHRRTGGIHLFRFYARRARRLLPAAACVSAVTLLVGAFVYAPSEQGAYARSAFATFSYLSNIRFMVLPNDYFAPETEIDPFLHTWSLAVEEQFYLVWPLILLFTLRRRSTPAAPLIAITGLSFAGYAALTMIRPQWAFFLMPARAWEFGLGGLAAVVPLHPIERRFSRALPWLGLAGVCGSATLSSAYTSIPAALPVVSTAVMLRVGALDSGIVGRALSLPPCLWLGRLSYGVYLWHWPVFVIAEAAFPGLTMWHRAGLIGATVLLAAAMHRLIENPIRFSRTLVPRPAMTLACAVALTMCGIAASGAEILSTMGVPRTPAETAIIASTTKPKVDDGCLAEFTNGDLVECAFGDPQSATAVVLLGDSHAAQWLPALERIATSRGWRLVTLLKSSCAISNVAVYQKRLRRVFTECAAWRRKAIRRAAELRPDLVIAGQFTRWYADALVYPHVSLQANFAAVGAGLRDTLVSLSASGLSVALLRDSPSFGFDVPNCLLRAEYHGREASRCAVARARALPDGAREAETFAASGLEHVALIDLTAHICQADPCAPSRDGVFFYRDSHHLSLTLVERLTTLLAEALAPALRGRPDVLQAAGRH